MKTTDISRRGFLKQGGALTAAGTVGTSWMLNLATMADAAAADSSVNYKALVCVFLNGGNDACNTVLPLDKDSFERYKAVRGSSGAGSTSLSLADASDALPSISATVVKDKVVQTVSYGLHPSLGGDDQCRVKALYKNGKLAILANVGTLLAGPLTRDIFERQTEAQRPPKLRSHNDQRAEWFSGRSNVELAGWGGRFAEVPDPNVPADNNNLFRSVAIYSNDLFGYGVKRSPFGMTDIGNGVAPLQIGEVAGKLYGGASQDTLVKLVRGLAGGARSNLLEQDYQSIVGRALDGQSAMTALIGGVLLDAVALPKDPIDPLKDNTLAAQLKMVARVIEARIQSGQGGRQVFFVSLGGFDTHTDQMGARGHAYLLSVLDGALGYFADVLGDDIKKVTTFTASDFGRQLNNNGDGTDHGWGGHHFIMGGAVKGGQVYGRVPSYSFVNGHYTDPQMLPDGAMIPVVSVGSYAATLGRWFGVGDADLKAMFPYLYAEGGVSPLDVGFMA
jgi:uncharacterized protein (DUF1501 family)